MRVLKFIFIFLFVNIQLIAGSLVMGNGVTSVAAANTAVTSYSSGSLRSDFFGQLGFRFVPDANMTITHAASWKVAGNAQSHTVTFYNAVGTSLASVTVDFTGGAGTAGQFNYTALGTPLAITSGSTYYIACTETVGGDQWYGDDGTSTMNTHFSGIWSTYIPNGGGINTNTFGKIYIPVDFKFTIP